MNHILTTIKGIDAQKLKSHHSNSKHTIQQGVTSIELLRDRKKHNMRRKETRTANQTRKICGQSKVLSIAAVSNFWQQWFGSLPLVSTHRYLWVASLNAFKYTIEDTLVHSLRCHKYPRVLVWDMTN